MHRKQAAIIITVSAGIAAATYLALPPLSRLTAGPAPASPATNLGTEKGRYLFFVSLHTPEEISGLLTRAEELSKKARTDSLGTGIALVLHGPEIEIFARKNYPKFRATVDQAARLDAEHIIDVKICRTEMKLRGIKEEDLPAFIEVVPYGPEEVARLRRQGYVYF
jgi:uncharacterized protein